MGSKESMQTSNEINDVVKTVYGLDKAINTIQDAISNKRPGKNLNIAIISLPYGGSPELVDELITLYPHEVNRTIFSSITGSKESFPLPERKRKIMIFDNCHYLYARKIGGFEQIEDLLSNISSYDDGICITTWNIYSWNYLVQVLNVDKYFSLQVNVPSLPQNEIKDILMSGSYNNNNNNNNIQFVDESEESDGALISFLKNSVMKKLTNRKLKLYTFKEITKLSYGNPVVAKNIWNEWLDGNIVRTDSIKKAYVDINLDDIGSFVLFLLVATGYVKKEEIADVVNSNAKNNDILINKALFHLSEIDVITKNNEYYCLRPEMIYSAIKYLEGIRLVW